ncbi:lamin tail domain-containing protein, partial [Candidatus Bipolaricaulota bacterium]|nr:lamin tail domain-containing protein [Candidatus Bipolaricaulota bacterium]
WSGTPSDADHEWIELRNLGSTPVDLTGWTLQWRQARPDLEQRDEDVAWISIPLQGEIEPATVPACGAGHAEVASRIVLAKRQEDDISWLVTGEQLSRTGGFYLLERLTDETVSSASADLVYDMVEPFAMELPDDGAIMRLVDSEGNIVDTANDDPRYGGMWVAGYAPTRASMERLDPLGPDLAENWQTNLGVEIFGKDAGGLDLWATAATLNSESLEGYAAILALAPTVVESGPGIEFEVAFAAADGLPWVRVLEGIDDPAGAAGAGGGDDGRSYRVGYSFRLSFEGNSEKVAVDVGDLPPGRYDFWFALGDERMVYVPVSVTP